MSLEQQLSAVERECTLLELITETACNERAKMQFARALLLNLQVPVNRIPDEILSYIFELVLRDNSIGKWKLKRDSYHKRRKAALSTCTKWSRVAISDPNLVQPKIRIHLICYSQTYVS